MANPLGRTPGIQDAQRQPRALVITSRRVSARSLSAKIKTVITAQTAVATNASKPLGRVVELTRVLPARLQGVSRMDVNFRKERQILLKRSALVAFFTSNLTPRLRLVHDSPPRD